MGQQSEIFSRYRSLFNSKSVQPTESELSRKLNNMDFVDFLFELVRATKGQKQFKNIILKGSFSKLKKTDEINKVIIKSLFEEFGCDSVLIIPTEYTTKSATGIELSKNEIDGFGLFGMNPDEIPGKFIYEGNNPKKHVNFLLFKAQGVGAKNALDFKFKDRVLFQIYANTPNTFMFKFGEYYENKLFSVWLTDYLQVVAPIFNTVNFTAILTDLITGAISLSGNKSKIEIRKQSRLIKALQKLFGFCSEYNGDSGDVDKSSNEILKNDLNQNPNFNGENITNTNESGFGNLGTTSNDIFNFDFNDLDEIEQNTDLRFRGKIRFSTCGNLELDINPNDIIVGLEGLFNAASNDELYSYDDDVNEINDQTTQTVDDTEYDNSSISPNAEKSANFFDDALKNGAKKAIDGGETAIVIDLPTMNAELQLNILKAIPYALMQMVLSPKIMVIPKLFVALNGDLEPKSNDDFVKRMQTVILKIGTQITQLLIKNIFDAIKSDLIRLARDLALSFLKQRGLDYISTLRSLLALIRGFRGPSGGCTSVLDKLLKLLKLSNFGPMPMLPPPLIFIAGALKPGMNSVAMINDIKANLTEKGIETAPILPDGTPNNMMIAIEETVKVMITHIKTNSTIQTFGISGVGPVQGYGQIQ